jgi:hypothetical protein
MRRFDLLFRAWLAGFMVMGAAGAIAAPLTARLGYTADQQGGFALDADFSVSPSERLTLSAGAGHSQGAEVTGDLTGTLYNAGLSWRGERAGISLAYDAFDDSSNYQAGTLGARAWLAAGDFEFALLGRRRDLSVEVVLDLPLRTLRRELDFSATGFGLELGYAREDFSAYVMALQYDYDESFDGFLELIRSPVLERRPRIEALVGTFITQTQGAIDRLAGAGCEFGWGRHSLGLDLTFAHDAVLDSGSTSLALSYRQVESARIDWGLSAGLVDSDAFGGIGFLGVEIGLSN